MTDWNKVAEYVRCKATANEHPDYIAAIDLCERMARGELVEQSELAEEREAHNQTLTKLWRLETAVRDVEKWLPACTDFEPTYPGMHALLHVLFEATNGVRKRDLAHKQGWQEGYQAGREQAAEAAKLAGYEEGRADGYEEGRADGYEEGRADGYAEAGGFSGED